MQLTTLWCPLRLLSFANLFIIELIKLSVTQVKEKSFENNMLQEQHNAEELQEMEN